MRNEIQKVNQLLKARQIIDPLILDGAVDINRYISTTPRILWVLREPHGRGSWDLCTFTRQELFTYNKWKMTFGLVIRVTYGLLNKQLIWDSWADDPKNIADCLRNVAIININKRGGDARVNWSRLHQASIDFGDLIIQQIEALSPNIVILGGTIDILPEKLISLLKDLKNPDVSAIKINNISFVKAYHTNQRRITHKEYYSNICDALNLIQ